MGCLSYCRKGSASPQFAQSAQWCKQRYCIDLIYPILLLAIQHFALLAVGLPAVSSRWLSAVAPHGLPLFISGPPRSNFAAAVLPAVYSRWYFATAPHGLPVFIGGPASCVFPMALCHSAAILFAMAPRPATNLTQRRKVLRFG